MTTATSTNSPRVLTPTQDIQAGLFQFKDRRYRGFHFISKLALSAKTAELIIVCLGG